MKTPTIINEKEIEKKITEFLIEQGYDILPGIRVKGRYPDIIATKEDKIIMIEVKGSLGDLKSGIARAIDYSCGSHFSYLAIPSSRSSKKLKEIIKALGLGLIEVDDEIVITVKPEESKPLKSISKKLLKSEPKVKEELIKASTTYTLLTKISKHKKVVKLLLKYPNRVFTIRELSILSRIPYSTVWRLIRDLYSIGVVHLGKIGGSNACRLNKETPFLREIEKIVEIEALPHRLAAKEFAEKVKKLQGVKKIILFGSIAKGEEKLESDVDIAVIVDDKESVNEIDKINDKILSKYRISIMPLILTEKEVEENKQFKKELEKGEVFYERSKGSRALA